MEGSDRVQQDGIVDAVGDMVETYRNLGNLRITEGAAKSGSLGIFGMLVVVVSVFVLLFAGLGAAWWIGDVMDNMKARFFIVAAFYLLFLIVLLATAGSMILPWLRNIIVRKIYEQV